MTNIIEIAARVPAPFGPAVTADPASPVARWRCENVSSCRRPATHTVTCPEDQEDGTTVGFWSFSCSSHVHVPVVDPTGGRP